MNLVKQVETIIARGRPVVIVFKDGERLKETLTRLTPRGVVIVASGNGFSLNDIAAFEATPAVNPVHIKLLGHEFLAMTAAHFEGLSGAPAGSYIWEGEGVTLVASPVSTYPNGDVRWQVIEINHETNTEHTWDVSVRI